jgi:hypothetical protein
MIKFIYKNLGFFYRKLNIFLSLFFFNTHKDYENKKTSEIFNEIKKFSFSKKKIKKKYIFNSFINFRVKLREIISNKYRLKNFLREDEIHKIMFGLNRLIFLFELIKIKIDKNWKNIWSKIINEQKIGSPIPYFLYPKSSGNRIHDTFNFKMLVDLNGRKKNFYNVIEFGGGYGSLCNLIKKIYKLKNYLIYDLPEVNALQYYYLKKLNHNVYINQVKSKETNAIYLFSDILKLNKFIKNSKLKNYMFISNWAFSEVPINLRKKFYLIINKSKITYLAFQKKFEKINNLNLFQKVLVNRNNKIKKFNRLFENHYYILSKKI